MVEKMMGGIKNIAENIMAFVKDVLVGSPCVGGKAYPG
jgi:hypothetical protein